MRRQFLVIAFAVVLAAEAMPLFVTRASNCICAIKSACCRLNMCPLKKSHQESGTRLGTCAGHTNAEAGVPSFQWRAMPPVLTLLAASPVPVDDAASPSLRPLDGAWVVAEPPPREVSS